MINESIFTSAEAEIRQNLWRGYRRVRDAQGQGVYLRGAECILELLGDPQLLMIVDSNCGLRLRIPVVYVADWRLAKGDDAIQYVTRVLENPEEVLTCYRRQFSGTPDNAGIHEALVHAIQPLIAQFPDKRVLLDWLSAPRPEEEDHDEIRSENWFAFHQAQKNPDSIFARVSVSLPSQVRAVDGLVRLTFPLCSCELPVEMVTLVLGIAFERNSTDGACGAQEATSRSAQLVRRLATVLMTEIPQLYQRLASRKQHSPAPIGVPPWFRSHERDNLHAAVDDLHRKIIGLASRVGLSHWQEPKYGFNFVVAFRELDSDYTAKLKYCLSIYNLHAVGFGHDGDTERWKAVFKERFKRSKESLKVLFLRNAPAEAAEESFAQFERECLNEIEKIFASAKTTDEIRHGITQSVESIRYHMRLTPGYWVMDLCHPEIIRDWLTDPRAKNFERYPAKLLVWETSALPEHIYYSPIVDGAVPVGVCGVSNELIESNICPAYELQELIDDSASRIRRILSSRELDMLGRNLRERCAMVGSDPDAGFRLWMPILLRFRSLAYYYLPNVYDYHTKLVRNKEVEKLFRSPRWKRHGDRCWWEMEGLSSNELSCVQRAQHLGDDNEWPDPEEQDFLGDFIRETLNDAFNTPRPMPSSSLHRIMLREDHDVSLLVLIPRAFHNDLAHDLINRFLNTSEAVLEEYANNVRKYGKLARSSDEELKNPPFDVFLSYKSADRAFVETIARGLVHAGIRPWFDLWAVLPGDSWYEKIEAQIDSIPCLAVFIGSDGMGPWQTPEVRALMISFNQRGGRLVPILIDGRREDDGDSDDDDGGDSPSAGGLTRNGPLPPFLRQFSVIDCQASGDPVGDLVRAIRADQTA